MICVDVVTVSDRCFVGENEDKTGPTYASLLSEMGFLVSSLTIVPDSDKEIKRIFFEKVAQSNSDVILFNGGTGIAETDRTPDVISSLLDKRLGGVEQQLIAESCKQTKFGMLSRIVVGTVLEKCVTCFPGSPKAVAQLCPTLFSVLPHILALLKGDTRKVQADHGEVVPVPNPVVNRPRQTIHAMIEVGHAQDLVFNLVDRIKKRSELVPVDNLVGRVLFSNVIAKVNIPPFPASIKDGYALKFEDKDCTILQVSCASCAGDTEALSLDVARGCCVRISTGAPLPANADTVVQVEDTELVSTTADGTEEEAIRLLKPPARLGQDIRPIGSDLKAGTTILNSGTVCGVSELGLLAASGNLAPKVNQTGAWEPPACFPCFEAPKVAVFSTGNEISTPFTRPNKQTVYDSNSLILVTLLRRLLGAEKVLELGIAGDTRAALAAKFREAFDRHDCDVVVTSGGVSMGEKDLLVPVLTQDFDAHLHFARVFMKPGKPTTMLTMKRPKDVDQRMRFCFALPGNPASVFVTSQLFVLPALRRWQSYPPVRLFPPTLKVRLVEPVDLDPRPDFKRAQLRLAEDGVIEATCEAHRNQMSSCLASCISASLLLKLPPARTDDSQSLPKGAMVEAFVLDFAQ